MNQITAFKPSSLMRFIFLALNYGNWIMNIVMNVFFIKGVRTLHNTGR